MRRLKASDFPNDIWEYGSPAVKRCLRRMRLYARVDFEIPDNEIEEVIKFAMSVCPVKDDDEIIWEAINLTIIDKGSYIFNTKFIVNRWGEIKWEGKYQLR